MADSVSAASCVFDKEQAIKEIKQHIESLRSTYDDFLEELERLKLLAEGLDAEKRVDVVRDLRKTNLQLLQPQVQIITTKSTNECKCATLCWNVVSAETLDELLSKTDVGELTKKNASM